MSTNRIFLTTLGLTGLFLATGGVELGASIAFKNTMDGTGPADGDDAIRRLLYERFPLLAGTVNGAFVMATAVFVGLGLLMPTRGLLKAGGYMVTVCALFTLCVGVFLWIMTLQVKAAFSSVYLAQEPEVQSLIQQSFKCCGYFNASSPAFVTDTTCTSPAAAALLRGCSTSISSFANIFIDNIFTALFGMVGADAVLILSIACLLKDRKERVRYQHIDEKSGFTQF